MRAGDADQIPASTRSVALPARLPSSGASFLASGEVGFIHVDRVAGSVRGDRMGSTAGDPSISTFFHPTALRC